MKRFLLPILLALFCLPTLPALAEDELVIVHATDMHYLSPSLTDYGEGFMSVIERADGKMTHYTPQLMQAFVDDMLALQPDAIILSGDLTLNGAVESHAGLTALLQPLLDAGIRLLALPGNHDAGSAAYRFDGEYVYWAEAMTDEGFDDMYLPFGYQEAFSRDAASQSYVSQLAPQVWCLLVDTNANGTAGTVHAETLAWIEAQLIRAQEQGVTVISVTHQPALLHNRLFTFGYVINNSSSLLALYEQYGVSLNLCGHLHMQHIAQEGGMVEIAGSSLAVSPNQYGVLRMEGTRLLDYETRPVDVSGRAARTGQTDPTLTDFAACSAAFFDQTTRTQLASMFEGSDLTPEQQSQMTEFAVQLNAEYFSGRRTLTAEDERWVLWETHLPGGFFTRYMGSILMEEAQDMTRFSFAGREQ